MKKIKMPFFLSLSLIILQFPLLAAEPGFTTTEAAIYINEIYVPKGLNSETEAYVVIAGIYPNGCYHWKGSEITSRDMYTHIIKPIANVTQASCIMVLVPFVQRIQLGNLPTGSHDLFILSADGACFKRTLEIE